MVDDGILVIARSRTEHMVGCYLILARMSELRNFKRLSVLHDIYK